MRVKVENHADLCGFVSAKRSLPFLNVNVLHLNFQINYLLCQLP